MNFVEMAKKTPIKSQSPESEDPGIDFLALSKPKEYPIQGQAKDFFAKQDPLNQGQQEIDQEGEPVFTQPEFTPESTFWTGKENKNEQAFKILNGPGSDDERVKKLKQILPEATVKMTPDGKIMTLKGKRYPIFNKGNENYPTFRLPAAVADGKNVFGSVRPKISVQSMELNPSFADTIAGKRKVMRGWVTRALGKKVDASQYIDVTRDKYGTPILVVKKDFENTTDNEGLKYSFKKGKYYFSAMSKIDPAIARYGPSVAAGPLSAGRGLLAGMGIAGGVAAGNELGYQAMKKMAGVDNTSMMNIVLNSALHGGLGMVGEGVGRAVFKVGGMAFNKLKEWGQTVTKSANSQIIDKAGNFTPEFIKVLESKGIKPDEVSQLFKESLSQEEIKNLTKEQALLSSEFKEVTGNKATVGQITQDVEQQGVENLMLGNWKEGSPLRQLIKDQDRGLYDYLEMMAAKMKGDTSLATVPAEAAGESIKTSLRNQQKAGTAEVSVLYNKAGAMKGADDQLPLEAIKNNLDELMKTRKRAIPSEIRSRIKAIFEGEESVTVKSLNEDIIPFINELLPTANAAQARSLTMLKSGLLKIADGMKSPSAIAYTSARAAAAKNFDAYDSGDIVAQIIKGNGADEKTVEKLFASSDKASRKSFEKAVTLLKKTDEGKQALRNMRETVIRDIADRSGKNVITEVGKNLFEFSGSKFNTYFNALMKTGKMQALFTPKELGMLKKLQRVAVSRVTARSTSNPSNSTNIAMNVLNSTPGSKWIRMIFADRFKKGAEEEAKIKVREYVSKKGTQNVIDRLLNKKPKNLNIFTPAGFRATGQDEINR